MAKKKQRAQAIYVVPVIVRTAEKITKKAVQEFVQTSLNAQIWPDMVIAAKAGRAK